MPTQTAESQSKLTPDDALAILKEGNQRFLSGTQRKRELNQQVIQTAQGQYPFASIVGCIDSRVPTIAYFRSRHRFFV
jgi:carbonic anhydrase